MPTQPTPPPPTAAEKVPDKLVDELHGATQKFHDARKDLEAEMETPDFAYQERVDRAANKVREAEQEVEKIEDRIADKIHPAPASEPQ
jgi:hypothetical protein